MVNMTWDETKAYEDGMIWLPKSRFNVKGLKAALTFIYGNSEYNSLKGFHSYVEQAHHLGVPRHFLERETIRSMGVELVDLRPEKYEEIDIYSKVQLDKLRPELSIQTDAVEAALKADDGIVSLACVTGDTLININRAGIGKRMTVEWVYRALRGTAPRKWDLGIPTNIRSLIGNRIGLNRVIDVTEVGVRPVFLLELGDGKKLKLTSDHEVLTLHGYRSIDGGLTVRSLVVTDSGQVSVPTLVPVVKIKPAGEEVVYDVACQSPYNSFVANGIVIHNCGNGKSPVGLHIWAQHRVPLLIVTDETSILEQWAKMIGLFISPSDIPIGRVYGGKKEWHHPVVLASVQSLLKALEKGFPDELRRRFGMVIYDECHVTAAPKFNLVAPVFTGRRLGLSATPSRTDRLDPVYQYHLGPVVFQDLSQPLKAKFYFWTPESSRNLTDDPSFRRRTVLYGELNVQKMWTALSEEEKRTREIATAIRKYGQGRRTLVISQRKEFLYNLNKLIPNSGVIVSETPLAKRQTILAEADVVLGIMRIAQKGLDSPTLSLLVLCEPFKDENLFQQVIGRLLREHPSKPDPIVIVVQDDVGKGGGPVYGLCRKLKRTINEWPASRGGPYTFDIL